MKVREGEARWEGAPHSGFGEGERAVYRGNRPGFACVVIPPGIKTPRKRTCSVLPWLLLSPHADT